MRTSSSCGSWTTRATPAARAVHADVGGAAGRARGLAARRRRRSRPSRSTDRGELPPPLRRAAEQLGASGALQLPVREGNAVVGSLELLRRRGEFDERERTLARGGRRRDRARPARLRRRRRRGCRGARPARPRRRRARGRLGRGPRRRPGGDARGRGDRRERLRRLALRAAGPGAGRRSPARRSRPRSRSRPSSARATCPARSRSSRWRKAAPSSRSQLGEPPHGALQLLLAEEPDPSDPLLDRLGDLRRPRRARAARRRAAADARGRARAHARAARRSSARRSRSSRSRTRSRRRSSASPSCSASSGSPSTSRRRQDGSSRRPSAASPARTRASPSACSSSRSGPRRGRGLLVHPDAASDPRLGGVRDALEELGHRGRARRAAARARRR